MGDRMDNIHPGAMPWLHRYVGNPILTGVLNVFFRTGVSDAHCGMRAVRRDVLPRLDLRTTGMEFASEMVIRASKEKLDIREFPIEYHPRGGESKLSSFRDGWRHLRFLLVHSPTHLFMLPGALILLLGTIISLVSLTQIDVFGREWDLHTMVAGALLMIVGVQVVALGLCAHAYGTYFMNEKDPWFDRMRRRFRLEHGLAARRADGRRRARDGRGDRRHLDRPRLRPALGGAPRGARRDARDRRHPDLLHVLPALHTRPAPARLMRGAIAVVAVTAGAVIAVLAAGLATSGLHSTGGNMLAPQRYVAVVGPGERLCQESEQVPAGSGSLELNVGTYGRPGPALEISVGRTTRGARAGGYRDGWVRVRFGGAASASPAREVCVRNRGDARLAVAGKPTHPQTAARVAGKPAEGRVTLRWRAAQRATWWADGAEIARRVTRGKADLGPWTPLALLAVVWFGAFALVLRSARA